jgi:Nif-specific regulatory protein
VADEKNAVLFSVAEHGAAGDGSPAGSVVAARISSAVAAPILGPGANGEAEVRGVLYSDRRGERPPLAEAELHLLSAAAEQAGEVLRHLESQARLRCANETLIRSIVDSKRIVGDSEPIREVHRFIHKAAPTSLTVLIRGETGTGKELVAAAIHYHSARQGKPFVTINCAAIPENLVESELFGHEKGAFTSATGRKKGRFELADSGTVFLDELGELAPACQAKLLRLLEEQRFERVGGTQTIEVDVRIIAATNKDLAGAVAAGQFREDLFYRLNVLGVELPPLRDRPEDVPILAEHFLADIGVPKERRSLSQEVTEKLCRYTWPGNVRQLRNVIESAMVLGEGSRIRVQDLVLPSDAPSAGGSGTWRWQPESLDAMQKRHIQRVLEHTGGNKKKAAEILGIERCTLYSKLKSYGITPK